MHYFVNISKRSSVWILLSSALTLSFILSSCRLFSQCTPKVVHSLTGLDGYGLLVNSNGLFLSTQFGLFEYNGVAFDIVRKLNHSHSYAHNNAISFYNGDSILIYNTSNRSFNNVPSPLLSTNVRDGYALVDNEIWYLDGINNNLVIQDTISLSTTVTDTLPIVAPFKLYERNEHLFVQSRNDIIHFDVSKNSWISINRPSFNQGSSITDAYVYENRIYITSGNYIEAYQMDGSFIQGWNLNITTNFPQFFELDGYLYHDHSNIVKYNTASQAWEDIKINTIVPSSFAFYDGKYFVSKFNHGVYFSSTLSPSGFRQIPGTSFSIIRDISKGAVMSFATDGNAYILDTDKVICQLANEIQDYRYSYCASCDKYSYFMSLFSTDIVRINNETCIADTLELYYDGDPILAQSIECWNNKLYISETLRFYEYDDESNTIEIIPLETGWMQNVKSSNSYLVSTNGTSTSYYDGSSAVTTYANPKIDYLTTYAEHIVGITFSFENIDIYFFNEGQWDNMTTFNLNESAGSLPSGRPIEIIDVIDSMFYIFIQDHGIFTISPDGMELFCETNAKTVYGFQGQQYFAIDSLYREDLNMSSGSDQSQLDNKECHTIFEDSSDEDRFTYTLYDVMGNVQYSGQSYKEYQQALNQSNPGIKIAVLRDLQNIKLCSQKIITY